MSVPRALRLVAMLFVLTGVSATQANAVDCNNGRKVGNPHCNTGSSGTTAPAAQTFVAPLPSLGAGIPGALIIAGGLYLAVRRRKRG